MKEINLHDSQLKELNITVDTLSITLLIENTDMANMIHKRLRNNIDQISIVFISSNFIIELSDCKIYSIQIFYTENFTESKLIEIEINNYGNFKIIKDKSLIRDSIINKLLDEDTCFK